jgi:hypothetical protein
MARIETDPNYDSPTFSRGTSATDIFKKEDVQGLAAAVSTHVHDGVQGLVVTTVAPGSINGAAIADGAVTSAKIADGTIVAADLADAGITNAKLGPDVARANQLTNGGFEIWQRGVGPFAATNAFTSDRWQIVLVGTDTLSVSRDNANLDTAFGGLYCAACTFVLGTGAGSTVLYQNLSSTESGLLNRTITLSVRVRTATANAVRIGIYNGSAYTYSALHPGGGAYQTLTVTATVTAGAANVFAAISFMASCTAYIDNAMLVVGSQAANYVPLHPADDLARCLRYYETLVVPANNYNIGVGQALSASAAYAPFSYKVKKAVTPTVTSTGPFQFAQANGTQVGTGATLVAAAIGIDGCQFASTSLSGLVAGNASLWTGSLNSVLAIEANP